MGRTCGSLKVPKATLAYGAMTGPTPAHQGLSAPARNGKADPEAWIQLEAGGKTGEPPDSQNP